MNLPQRPQLDPAARQQLIERRRQLQRTLVKLFARRASTQQSIDEALAALVAEYGAAEVERMQDRIQHQHERPTQFEADEAWLYADYLRLHRRFGGTRRLLAQHELEALKMEYAQLWIRRDVQGLP